MNIQEGFSRLGLAIGAIAAVSTFVVVYFNGGWGISSFWELILVGIFLAIVFALTAAVVAGVGWVITRIKAVRGLRFVAFVLGSVSGAACLTIFPFWLWRYVEPMSGKDIGEYTGVLSATWPLATILAFGLPFGFVSLLEWVIEGFKEELSKEMKQGKVARE